MRACPKHHASELQSIARRAMLDNGLEPDFPPAAVRQLAGISAAPAAAADVRDLRALPWCSIDNDDSRDLDQLSVAQPQADGAVQILIAIADVDATVTAGHATRCARQHQYHLGVHRGRDLSHAAGAALDRPHLPGGGAGAAQPGDRHDRGRRRRGQRRADLPCPGGQPRQARLRQRRRLARRARRQRRPPSARSRGWTSSCASRMRPRSG